MVRTWGRMMLSLRISLPRPRREAATSAAEAGGQFAAQAVWLLCARWRRVDSGDDNRRFRAVSLRVDFGLYLSSFVKTFGLDQTWALTNFEFSLFSLRQQIDDRPFRLILLQQQK